MTAHNDLDRTLRAIKERHWQVVLLEPGTKRLQAGATWNDCATRDISRILEHLDRNGGIGLDVAASGVAVLDFDVAGSLSSMMASLGPLPPPTATSPSGGFHIYVAPKENLPSQILWEGQRVGDIIRGPRQQVVLPPSPYPGSPKRGVPAGGNYRWLSATPWLPPYELLAPWRDHLLGGGGGPIPEYLLKGTGRGMPDAQDEPSTLPSAMEMLQRAQGQPGARRRAAGIKFQCPACQADGHDRHRDNAIVFNDGRWACAYAPQDARHRRMIGVALGVLSAPERVEEAKLPEAATRAERLGDRWEPEYEPADKEEVDLAD